MGYEAKLYAVDKSSLSSEIINNKILRFARVIATFDLCVVPQISLCFRNKGKVTDCYFYDIDGNTPVVEDLYGEPLLELSVQKVIDCIEECKAEGDNYRRYDPCLGLLKGFDLSEWDDLVVLHYGH